MKNISIKSLFVFTALFIFFSCNSVDPEYFRSDVEDVVRLQIKYDKFNNDRDKNSSLIASLRYWGYEKQASAFEKNYNDEYQVFKLVADRAQEGGTYYNSLLFFRAFISDYVQANKVKIYSKIIDDMILEYNNTKIELSPFKTISFNTYTTEAHGYKVYCKFSKINGRTNLVNTIERKSN